MGEKQFLSLQKVVTPTIQVTVNENGSFFANQSSYCDADDELGEISKFIKSNSDHNADIDVSRIKFLYTTKPKKDGGRYVIGQLSLRSDIDKMVNDDYDYIISVHYKVWKELDMENKVIQLDKMLCGILLEIEAAKKKSADSKEFVSNLRHFGAEKVLNSSEAVDMAIDRIVEDEKEQKKAAKKGVHIDIPDEDAEKMEEDN